jgi:tetratricopeptide (TPR) repeat protein
MPRSKLVFFSMPFGVKNVEAKPHDFDETWRKLLKPAVPQGWEDVRIDEANQPGPIVQQFKHYLRVADVVVFDLTSSNPNVLYELGIRDVFAPGRRVLVMREDARLPFDLGTERALAYAVDVEHAVASPFRDELQEQILAAAGVSKDGTLAPPDEDRLRAQMDRATTVPALVAVWKYWARYSSIPVDTLLRLAAAFSEHRRLDLAVDVARRAYREEPNDWDVARMLGWYLRKSGSLDDARSFLEQALALNEGDAESMGMLGGMHKRKGLVLLGRGADDDAVESFRLSKDTYERAVEIDPLDIYNLVNVGALTFVSTAPGTRNPAYEKVIQAVWGSDVRSASTWDLLALGEAHLVLGQTEEAKRVFSDASQRTDFTSGMRTSVIDQLDLLEKFGLPASGAGEVRAILVGEKVRPAKTVVLIHLSDIHFGRKPDGSEMHRFRPKGPLHQKKTLAEHVIAECSKEKASDVGLFLIISGDVAYQAKSDEYRDAAKFTKDLMRELALDPAHLVIVPGNHDVNWTLSSNERVERFDEFLKFVRGVFGKDQFPTFYPFVTWDFDVTNTRPQAHEILSVHKVKDDGVVFIGFNSCVVEDEKQHFGAIGQEQVELAKRGLADVDPSWLRIAILHHHVLPLERQLSLGDEGTSLDGTIVRDFAVLESSLHALQFDMVLHGHKHDPGVRVSRLVNAFGRDGGKSIIVCGAGSAGVERDELPADRGNHFGIYRIPAGRRTPGAPFVDVEWMELPYNDVATRWTSTGRWSVEG